MRKWGNDTPHKEALKDALKNLGLVALVFGTFALVAGYGLWLNHAGIFDFSGGSSQMGNSTYYLKVAADGETVYTGAENVSEAVREVIMDTAYPTPEAAIDAAVEFSEPTSIWPEWFSGFFGMRAAQAHAVLLCTTRDGVISNNTGGSWHSTYHRFDRDGRRYTKTYHVLNAYPSPVVTDTFFASIDKKYC